MTPIPEIIRKGKNEPQLPGAVSRGFLFLPTAGVRSSPHVLVLELFREVFFREFAPPKAPDQELLPWAMSGNKPLFTTKEQAVLYAVEGRKRESGSAHSRPYYAPAYPVLARHSWLRRRSERVVDRFLFRGPIAQYFRGTGKSSEKKTELEDTISVFYRALKGHQAATAEEFHGKEILSVALKDIDPGPGLWSEEEAKEHLRCLFAGDGDDPERIDTVFRTTDDDPLARRISHDFYAVCQLEKGFPRMQWLEVLMAFLRFALPMWMLAQMRLTVIVRDWVTQVLDGGSVPDTSAIARAIGQRNRRLLHPTVTPTREVFEHVERYMRARVELSILLYYLAHLDSKGLGEKTIVTVGKGSDRIALDALLDLFRGRQAELAKEFGTPIRAGIVRRAEEYPAWKNPLKKGQGENIEEFLRVLYRAREGDEGGSYLLIRRGREPDTAFIVFPGPTLLRTFTYLAERRKDRDLGKKAKGKLVISDLEDHFREYGIEFAATASARPQLLKSLQEISLLKGSPDAGDSAELILPFEAKE